MYRMKTNQPASQEPKNKVRMALQEQSCHGEKKLHPPPIFNSVYSRGPFIPWMPPKTVPPTM